MRVPFFLVLSLLLLCFLQRTEGSAAAAWAGVGLESSKLIHQAVMDAQAGSDQIITFRNEADFDWIFNLRKAWSATNPLVPLDCSANPVMEWMPSLLGRREVTEMLFFTNGNNENCGGLVRYDVQYISSENHRDKLIFKFTMSGSKATDVVVTHQQYRKDGSLFQEFWWSNYMYESRGSGWVQGAATFSKKGGADSFDIVFIQTDERSDKHNDVLLDNFSELSWLLTDSPKHYIFHGLPTYIRAGSSLLFSIDLSETRFASGDAVATYQSGNYTLKLVVDYTDGRYDVFKMILEAPGAAWTMQVNEGGHDTRAQGTHQMTIAKSDKIYSVLAIDEGSTL